MAVGSPSLRAGGPGAVLMSPAVRWGLLTAVLAAEAVGLTLRFSAPNAPGSLPELLLSLSKQGFRLLVVVAAAALLLRWGPASRRHGAGRAGAPPLPLSRTAMLAHAVALAAFAWLTMMVIEGPARPPRAALAWALAWSATGAATLVSWVAIGLPPGRWAPALRKGPGLLLIGGACGLWVWGAGHSAQELWAPLGGMTLRSVESLLRALGMATICEPSAFLVGTPRFKVWIGPKCSGYEGMGLVLGLVSTYLWGARRGLRFPRALLLLPAGVVLIWTANVLRITALIALGDAGLGAVAMGGFHSQAGWLSFVGIGLVLVYAAGNWEFLRVDAPARVGRDDAEDPTGPYLVPLIALLGSSMLASAVSNAPEGLYAWRLSAVAAVLWVYRRHYAHIRRTFSFEAVAIGVGAFALWMALEPLAPGRGGPPPGGDAAWMLARVLGSVLIVPVVEELAFRGYLTRRLIAPDCWNVPIGAFSWPSLLISSSLFGLLHGRWLAGTLTGMLFGLALYRRRELADAVVAHATTNALIAVWVLVTGDLGLWG